MVSAKSFFHLNSICNTTIFFVLSFYVKYKATQMKYQAQPMPRGVRFTAFLINSKQRTCRYSGIAYYTILQIKRILENLVT